LRPALATAEPLESRRSRAHRAGNPAQNPEDAKFIDDTIRELLTRWQAFRNSAAVPLLGRLIPLIGRQNSAVRQRSGISPKPI
jgi:hypothetical protein